MARRVFFSLWTTCFHSDWSLAAIVAPLTKLKTQLCSQPLGSYWLFPKSPPSFFATRQICTRRTPRKGSNKKTGNMFRATDIYTYINHRPIRYKLLIIQEKNKMNKATTLLLFVCCTSINCKNMLSITSKNWSGKFFQAGLKQKKKNQIVLFKQVTLSSPHLYRLLYRRVKQNDVPRPLNRRTRSAMFTFATLDLQVCAGLCRQITFVAKLTCLKANKSVKWFRQSHLLGQRLSQPRSSRCSAPPYF